MTPVPSVYTLLINPIYLFHITQVAGETFFRKHTVQKRLRFLPIHIFQSAFSFKLKKENITYTLHNILIRKQYSDIYLDKH